MSADQGHAPVSIAPTWGQVVTCSCGATYLPNVSCPNADQGRAEALSAMKSDLFRDIVKATTDDPTGHLPNCGYTDEAQVCGCAEWGRRLAEAIAPYVALRAEWEARAKTDRAAVESPIRCPECAAPMSAEDAGMDADDLRTPLTTRPGETT